jgi:hypothetical protein
MSGAAEFLDFLRQTITVEPFTGRNQFGAPTYGAAVSYNARVGGKQMLVRDTQGQQVVSRQQVWIATAAVIKIVDRLTLPAGYDPQVPVILSVERPPDETGQVHHAEVFLA